MDDLDTVRGDGGQGDRNSQGEHQGPTVTADPGPDVGLGQTVAADLRAATGWRVLAVVALLGWMAFQWGLGNDILLPSIAANAFDRIDDGDTWTAGIAAVVAAAAAGGAFWAVTQVFDALVMLSGLRLVPAITARLSAFLRRKGWVTPYAEMPWSTRWIIAYATGPSVLCLVDVFATGRPGVRARLPVIAAAVVLSAGTVALVVAAVATAAMIAARIPATEAGAEVFIRFAKNPLTWVAIFVTVFTVSRALSRRRGTATTDPAP